MRDLDETDMEILRLLAADSRRSYSDIGAEVDLSGPAVSDRIERLQETGVIRRFTIDVDRTKLRAGVPVLVRLDVAPDDVETAREDVSSADGVEHVFVSVEGEVVCYARVESRNVRSWLRSVTDADVRGYEVTLIDSADWNPVVEGTEFALACAECGNEVTSEGETARLGGDVYHFCCPSCLARFRERYEELEAEA